mgnify:CR=1 FL=1
MRVQFPRMTVRCLALLCGWVLLCGNAFAQLPQTRAFSIYPMGWQAGQSCDLVITSGTDLEDISQLLFSHPGITAKPKTQDVNGKPQPISDREAARYFGARDAMAAEPKKHVSVDYEIGDSVKVLDGPFNSFTGVVEELDFDKNRVKVSVSIFGRATPVELDFEHVELVK